MGAMRKNRLRRKAAKEKAGICQQCRRKAEPGTRLCPVHAAVDRERKVNPRHGSCWTYAKYKCRCPACCEAYLEKHRRERQVKRDRGECFQCSRPALEGKTRCFHHAEYDRQRKAASRTGRGDVDSVPVAPRAQRDNVRTGGVSSPESGIESLARAVIVKAIQDARLGKVDVNGVHIPDHMPHTVGHLRENRDQRHARLRLLRSEIKSRRTAREFLSTDNEQLSFWCACAGIDADRLRAVLSPKLRAAMAAHPDS